MIRKHLPKSTRQKGNIFFMLFASIALVGAFGVGASNVMKGLVTSMSDVTRKTIAEERMTSAARLVFQNAVENSPARGNCDSDTKLTAYLPELDFVEPLPTRDPGSLQAPVGGGFVPLNIGAATKDPWGTNYGYCAWNPGTSTTCADSTRRLAGANNPGQTVVAVISAGKDRKFSTTCNALSGGGGGGAVNDRYLITGGKSDDGYMCALKQDGSIFCWGAPEAGTPAGNDFVAISGGWYNFVCALRSNGTIACWGSGDSNGQVSNAPSGSGFVQIDAGNDNACALKSDGSIECWGKNNIGQSTPPAGNDYTEVSCGYEACYALKSDGSIVKWGNPGGTYAPPAGSDFVSLGAGDESVCGVKADGTLGCNNVAPLPGTFVLYRGGWDSNCGLATDGSIHCVSIAAPPGNNFLSLGVGDGYGCAVKSDRSVTCFGSGVASPAGSDFAIPGDLSGGGGGSSGAITKAQGSDDLVMEFSYNDVRGLSGDDLWQVSDVQPDTAAIDKNIEVAGGASFTGKLELLKKGLILPTDPGDNSITGVCGAGNAEQLRLNSGTSPISLEICHNNAWVPISMGAGGGGSGFCSFGTLTEVAADASHTGGYTVQGNRLWTSGSFGMGGDNVLGSNDITDPLNPSQGASISDAVKLNAAGSMTVSGNYAYVGSWDGDSVTVVDISNPASPTIANGGNAWVTDSGILDTVADVEKHGNYIIASSYESDTITMIDVSNPLNPVIASSGNAFVSDPALGGADGMTVDGNYLYVAAGQTDSLVIVDISNPLSPSVAGSVQDSSFMDWANNVRVKGNYAFVVSYNANEFLVVVDITNKAAPVVNGHINVPGMTNPYAMELIGNYLLVAHDNGLKVFDVSTPTSPTLEASYSNAGVAPWSMAVKGQYAFIADVDHLSVIDLTCDPAIGDGSSGGGGGSASAPTNGLVAYYKMNESSGTTAADSSSSGNNGTLMNMAPTWGAGKRNNALSFDGNDDMIEIPDDNALDLTGNGAITAWVKKSSGGDWSSVLAKGDTNDNRYINYGLEFNDSDRLVCSLSPSAGSGVTEVWSTNTYSGVTPWMHVTCTWDGSTMYLYVDGVLDNSTGQSVTPGANTGGLRIGSWTNADYFDGQIDEVRIYNRTLSAQEVTDVFNDDGSGGSAGSGSPDNITDGLAGQWKYDEGSGTSVFDSTGNGNTGTLTNMSSSWGPGKIGATLNFDGANDYVQIPNSSSINLSGSAITMATWAKMTADTGSYQIFLAKPHQSGSHTPPYFSYSIHTYSITDSTHMGIRGWVGTTDNDSATCDFGTIQTNVWHHYGTTYDGSNLKCYLDGVLVDTNPTTGTILSYNTPLLLGSNGGPGEYFSGQLDDTRIYSNALSDAGILALYNYTEEWSAADLEPNPAVVIAANQYRGKIASGDPHTCVIKPDASAWCAGHDGTGQLGNGATTGDQNSISRVFDGSAFVSISAGDDNTCGIKTDGSAWCWGEAAEGKLGNGTTTPNQPSPVAVSGGHVFTELSVGVFSVCGIRHDGRLLCWGLDDFGGLGNGGGSANVSSPYLLPDVGPWVRVSTGAYHACGIKADGSAWCWGGGASGRLGNGASNHSQSPVLVAQPGPWVDIAAGEEYSCGVKLNGSGWCWGNADEGRLGNGVTTGSFNTPQKIADAGPWLEITMNPARPTACGIKIDGSGWCWGDNVGDALGTGPTTSDALVPVPIADPGPWATLAPFCGIKVDGSAWCWALDTNGRKGNGPFAGDTNVPDRMLNFPAVAPFIWNNAASTVTSSAANIALGANSAIGYDGSVTAGVSNGLRFDTGGQTVLRQAGGITGDSSMPVNSGLIAYFPMDEMTGTTATDIVNGLTATAYNSPAWITNGRQGGALGFTAASSHYATVPDSLTLRPFAITLAFWMKRNGAQGDFCSPVTKNSGNGNTSWGVQFSSLDTELAFQTWGAGGANALYTVTPIPDNTWVQVVAVYDPAAVAPQKKLYINGVLDNSTTLSDAIIHDTDNLEFASGNTGAGPFCNISLDNVQIFNRGLTLAEVQSLYSGTATVGGVQLRLNSQVTNGSAQISWKTASAANTRSFGIDSATKNLELGLNNATNTNWMTAITPQMEISTNGSVGVGTSGTVNSKLEINGGGLRLGNDTDTCTSAKTGTLKYVTGSTPPYKYCNGSSWVDF